MIDCTYMFYTDVDEPKLLCHSHTTGEFSFTIVVPEYDDHASNHADDGADDACGPPTESNKHMHVHIECTRSEKEYRNYREDLCSVPISNEYADY